jgi:hypothetical protein|eukprot:SAG25_NODE_373_length_8948_cov_6.275059_11_plen_47_part_00
MKESPVRFCVRRTAVSCFLRLSRTRSSFTPHLHTIPRDQNRSHNAL